jgi:molybdopterin synthase sulfur carrier subunit
MIKIEFLGPISSVSQNCEIEANTLEDVINYIKSKEELSQWVDDLALAINDKLVKKSHDKASTLSDGDKISVLPPVCGG